MYVRLSKREDGKYRFIGRTVHADLVFRKEDGTDLTVPEVKALTTTQGFVKIFRREWYSELAAIYFAEGKFPGIVIMLDDDDVEEGTMDEIDK